jgi:hypothetical protein
MKGRFDLLINPRLSFEKKILKFVEEPIAYHLHMNRHFIDKLTKKKKTPLTTKQIIEKIGNEMKIVDMKIEGEFE